ncbi:uncharacterized protein K02A2.6-like [Anneissia japonica]|uniref:uncharacterized protein K02A2.6-like n=1 Tax=Anneissia japonica TaxID=1529436 RepID=UPI001425AA36|nr:uncharacterized protein K02A2.6-like [Anneissia japonica]
MSSMPKAPWKEVQMDFKGPLPNGKYLLVVYDLYNRFPEVEIVTSTSAQAVLPKLDAILARQGIPEIIQTDNGPPFTSNEFRQYAEYHGFKHKRITPLWPRANAEVERFMSNLKKTLLTASIEHRNTQQVLYEYLRQHRATPHTTTQISPMELMNGRKMSTRLPEITIARNDDEIRKVDSENKQKMKEYEDRKLNTKESCLKVGDRVLLKQRKGNAFTALFDPKPFRIIERNGNSIRIQRNDLQLWRNVSLVKKVVEGIKEMDDPLSDVELDSIVEGDSITEERGEKEKGKTLSKQTITRKSLRNRRMPKRYNEFILN